MAEGDQFLVRDTRMPGHFWADNEVLDEYGERLGPHGFAIYMALCRTAINGTGECRISTRKLAKQLRMSAGGAFNALALIVEIGLARQIHPGDRTGPGVYVLADVKALLNPGHAQLKLAGRGAHPVNTSQQIGVHGMNTGAHPVSAGVHGVNDVLTGCTRNKEVKTSSRLKTENRGRTGQASSPQFSQADFDQRDIRKMAEAVKEAEQRPSSVGSLDDKQYFEWICGHAGITVERGLHLEEIRRAWPKEKGAGA